MKKFFYREVRQSYRRDRLYNRRRRFSGSLDTRVDWEENEPPIPQYKPGWYELRGSDGILNRYLRSKVGWTTNDVIAEAVMAGDKNAQLLKKELGYIDIGHRFPDYPWYRRNLYVYRGVIGYRDQRKYQRPKPEFVRLKLDEEYAAVKRKYIRSSVCGCRSFRAEPTGTWYSSIAIKTGVGGGWFNQDQIAKSKCPHGNNPVIEEVWVCEHRKYNDSKPTRGFTSAEWKRLQRAIKEYEGV